VHLNEHITPGCVIVMDAGGSKEVGYWGSNNALGVIAAGAVGIVTDGYCRDTYEVCLQRTPVCCRKRGRPIIPGRIMEVEANTVIACGGVQVGPGDIVGCDDDGLVVVPKDLAEEVAVHAAAVLLADMRGRRRLYERLKMAMDETVDLEKVEAYYAQFR
jgi:regulator of RNase E activity RraA